MITGGSDEEPLFSAHSLSRTKGEKIAIISYQKILLFHSKTLYSNSITLKNGVMGYDKQFYKI